MAKSKRTEARAKALETALRLGVTHRLACAGAGIHKDTFYDWMNADPIFSDRMKRAEGKGAAELLARIKRAGGEHWTANAWLLERRFPQEYGRRVSEIQGPGGGPVEFVIEWQPPLVAGDQDEGETDGEKSGDEGGTD